MDERLRDVFAGHVRHQCRCLMVFEGMLRESETPYTMWAAIEGALSTSAIIGRLLWGGRRKWDRNADHQELREHLGVGEDSAFRSWLVRDHFQHVESRIEQWWASRDREESPAPIGSGGSFGTFSSATLDVSFWGDTVNLGTLFDEARMILYGHDPTQFLPRPTPLG